jgi:hypothetical protein
MQIISLDCETFPIRRGLLAPPVVCFGWARVTETSGDVQLAESGLVTDLGEHTGDLPAGVAGDVSLISVFRALAEYALALGPTACRWVNQNNVFDFACLAAIDKDLLELMFQLYDAGIVEDTMLREQLIDIAKGSLGWSSEKSEKTGKNKRKAYDLAALSKKYLGVDLDKTTYRMGYGYLSGKPLAQWPQGAVDYGIDDAIAAAMVWFEQRAVVFAEGSEDGEVPDSANQARYHFGLHLMSVWGLRTDPKMVFSFERYLRRAFGELREVLNDVGLIRKTGQKNMKAISEHIEELSKTAPGGEIEPKRTPKGKISTKAEHVEDLLGAYNVRIPKDLSEALTLIKIARLERAGVERPEWGSLKAGADFDDMLEEMLRFGLGLEQWGPEAEQFLQEAQNTGTFSLFDGMVLFAWYTSVQKLLGTYIPVLKRGTKVPINARYNPLVDTGRTSCSSPNIQNLPKAPGVRECYIPRCGWAFCSVDYEALELHTLAEVCLELLGHSALADALNEGLDPHLLMACEWLLPDCSYGQGVEIRKDENHPRYKEVKEARNLAKAANFGLPGGLGAQRFCDFCKASGIIITLDESKALKQAWLQQWPEMRQYFGLISSMLDTDEEGLEGVTLEQVYSARVRGKARYTAACNSYFQGLAADGAKDAVYELVKATFTPGHALYGSRLVAFIHDETIMEHPMLSREDLDARAKEQANIMLVSMEKFCRRVKPKAKPALMLRWYKDAIDRYDEDGFLIPWTPKQELTWN